MSNDNSSNIRSTTPFDWKVASPEFNLTAVDELLMSYQQLSAPSVEEMTNLTRKNSASLQDSVVKLFEDIDSGANPFKGYSEDDTVAVFGVVEAHLRTNLKADNAKVKPLTDIMLQSMRPQTEANKSVAILADEEQHKPDVYYGQDMDEFIFGTTAYKPDVESIQKLRSDAQAEINKIRLSDNIADIANIRKERGVLIGKCVAVAAGVLAFFTFNGRGSTNDTTSEKFASAEYIIPNSLPAPFETSTTLQIAPIEVTASSVIPQNSTETTVIPEETAQPVVKSLPPTPIETTVPIAKITPEEVSDTPQSLIAVQDGDGFERLFRREYGLSNEQAARLSNLLFVELSSLQGTYLDKATNSVRIGNVEYLDFSSINTQVMTLVTQIRQEA